MNPFIGTGFHGHTFPGATLPHGRVQLSPDTHIMGWDASSGYHYDDSTLYGFSHTHLSGTGIGDMGDFLFLPYCGDQVIDKPVAVMDHRREIAEPGYYKISVQPWNIDAELTATTWTGRHRYTYPTDQRARLFIDLTHVLQPNWGHRLTAGSVKKINDTTIAGFRVTTGWAAIDSIWFHCYFNHPLTNMYTSSLDSGAQSKNPLAVNLDFGILTSPLECNVAVSSVDQTGAEKNLLDDANFTFDEVRHRAQQLWHQALNAIEISTTDSSILTNFYTALYHTQMAPILFSDRDHRYRDLDQKIHQGQERHFTAYSLWDTFRAWFPLMSLIQPKRLKVWIKDLLQNAEHGGLLPKWPLNGNYTGTMVGYPAVSVIADAITKDLITSDLNTYLKAMITCAQWQPDFVQKYQDTRAQQVMADPIYYKEKYGIIPADSANGSVSYGLEMAYYDWCIAQVAKKAGDEKMAFEFEQRGKYYQNYFDPEVQFMHAVNLDGSFRQPFNPFYSDHEQSEYIEGNAWQWTPTVFHDIEGFVNLLGGPEALGDWLDRLFSAPSTIEGENASADITGLIGQYAHGNEPSHHIPYLYYFSDRPWKTQEILDTILYHFYRPEPGGIIGNEDCGQMSAWYVLNAIGLYQITPGKPIFHLGRPIVDEAIVRIGEHQTLRITTKNNSKQNKYIQKATLNGSPIDDHTVSYQELFSGGDLIFHMGPAP